jgi:hypothetical protein
MVPKTKFCMISSIRILAIFKKTRSLLLPRILDRPPAVSPAAMASAQQPPPAHLSPARKAPRCRKFHVEGKDRIFGGPTKRRCRRWPGLNAAVVHVRLGGAGDGRGSMPLVGL